MPTQRMTYYSHFLNSLGPFFYVYVEFGLGVNAIFNMMLAVDTALHYLVLEGLGEAGLL